MQAVEVVHNLCCEFGNSDGKKIFLSAKTVWNTWKLLITDGHTHIWEKELRLDDIDKLIQTLKMEENDYESFFKKFRQCIEAFNFSHIAEHEDLVANFRVLNGELPLKITLHPCIEDPKTRLTQLIFELVHIISRKKTDSVYTTTSVGMPSASSPKKPISTSATSSFANAAPAKRKNDVLIFEKNRKRSQNW